MNGDIAIRCRGLTRRFGELVAVNGVDLDVPRAAVYGFLGPNGSGKTTTMRMLCGLIMPSSGDIEVLGLKIPRDAETLKRRIGYMTQKFSLYEDLSVEENLRFLAAVQGIVGRQATQRIEQLLEEYRLGPRRKQLSGTMSGGQKQRLALAGAVLHAPELLLLDEPTSAVDPESRREFWEHLFMLADRGTTLLVSTHFMDEAERCHRLAILDRGRLVADGSPRQLTGELPYRVIRVECAQPRVAHQALSKLPSVAAQAQIGESIRVLVARDTATDAIDAALRAAGVTARLEEAQANLEDVFVVATRAA